MTKGKVSVITTCYNYAHFLPYSLESALGQTYQNVEVVVVNDGSPDNTDEAIRPYLSDPRVVYVKQANAGQAIATNNGIKAATGEFIAFLDADDIWAPTKLERQMPFFDAADVGVVYCRIELMDEKGDKLIREENNALLTPRVGWIVPQLFLDNFVPFSGSVARRECFDKSGMLDPGLKMSTDWDLWLRMAVHYKFAFADEVLVRYRLGHAGQMTKNREVHERDAMIVMEKFIRNHGDVLPKKLIGKAYAYSYCNRGYRQRRINAQESLKYYLRAIGSSATYGPAYSGMLKLFAYRLGRALGVKL
jgi:glycosyltransferase involved in cell wall biosynthesis